MQLKYLLIGMVISACTTVAHAQAVDTLNVLTSGKWQLTSINWGSDSTTEVKKHIVVEFLSNGEIRSANKPNVKGRWRYDPATRKMEICERDDEPDTCSTVIIMLLNDKVLVLKDDVLPGSPATGFESPMTVRYERPRD